MYLGELGGIANANGNNEEAIIFYKKAIAIEPNFLQNQVFLGNTLFIAKKNKEAHAVFANLMKKNPEYVNGWDQWAANYELLKDTEQAKSLREEATQKLPKNAFLQFRLGEFHDRQGNKEKVIQAYTKALEIEPMPNSIAAKRIFELSGKRVSPKLELMDSNRIPFRRTGSLMIVKVEVNGKPSNFLLDTGASQSVVFQEYLNTWSIKPSKAIEKVVTGNGIISAKIAYADLGIGKFHFGGVPVLVIPRLANKQFQGIIGMNVLNKFRFEIDNSNNQLILNK